MQDIEENIFQSIFNRIILIESNPTLCVYYTSNFQVF